MANEATAPTEAVQASDTDVKLIAGYPGPALLLDAAGTPLVANAKGAGLEKALTGGAVADIESLIGKAVESASIANATLTIATSRGELVLDVTAIPRLDVNGTVAKTLLLARDLTMERNLRTTLVESRQRYKDLVEKCQHLMITEPYTQLMMQLQLRKKLTNMHSLEDNQTLNSIKN